MKIPPTREQLIERWENCLRVLQALSPHDRKKHWDMSSWGYETDCGTVACAAGHCSLDGWFREQGFGSEMYASEFAYGDAASLILQREPEDFFGEEGTAKIFYNDEQRTVGTVIKEVRAYLKTLRAAP